MAERQPPSFTRAGTLAKRFAAKEALSKAVAPGQGRGLHEGHRRGQRLLRAPTLALTGWRGGAAGQDHARRARGGDPPDADRRSSRAQAFAGDRGLPAPPRRPQRARTPNETTESRPDLPETSAVPAAETKPAAADDTQGVNWLLELRGLALMLLAVVGGTA
jgi:hypothetical protein